MYRFQFEYDFGDMLTLNRVAAKVNRRVIVTILYIVLFLCGAFVALTGVLMLLAGDMVRGILFLVIGAAYMALILFRRRIDAWRSKRMLLKGTGELTVTLDGEGVYERSAKGEAYYPWRVFLNGCHSGGRYLLFIDKRHAAILPERALVEGDPAALKAFLEDRLQMEIKEIR